MCRNCGGSLRITASNDEIEEGTLDPLDATRISPTQYTLAKELARVIVGAEDDPEDDYLLQAQDRPMDVEGFNLHVRLCAWNAAVQHVSQQHVLEDACVSRMCRIFYLLLYCHNRQRQEAWQ